MSLTLTSAIVAGYLIVGAIAARYLWSEEESPALPAILTVFFWPVGLLAIVILMVLDALSAARTRRFNRHRHRA